MLEGLTTYLRRFHWPIFLAMLGLLAVGMLAISVTEQVDASLEGHAAKQMIFAGVGLAAFFTATLIPYPRVGRWSYAIMGVTLVLLVAVFRFPPRNGCHRWISIPGLDLVSLQPSELAKLSFILSLAWYLRFRSNYRQLRGLIVPFLITLVPLGLILKEPDLGTALLLLPTLMVMLFMAGAKLRHLAVIVALGLLVVLLPVPRAADAERFTRQRGAFLERRVGPVRFYRVDESLDWRRRPETPVAYCRLRLGEGGLYDLQPLSLRIMKDHQSVRITGWLRRDDERVRQNIGYQQSRSIAILAAGRLRGQDDWTRANSVFRQLPENHTDFIFSVIGGQWGLAGCLTVLALYGVIFVFGADIASATSDPFGRLLAMGVLALMAAQLFINVSMTVGLMPVTGMTLPLVSYGGSSLLVNCTALGLLVNVGRYRPLSLARQPFEYGKTSPEDRVHVKAALPGRVVDGLRR